MDFMSRGIGDIDTFVQCERFLSSHPQAQTASRNQRLNTLIILRMFGLTWFVTSNPHKQSSQTIVQLFLYL